MESHCIKMDTIKTKIKSKSYFKSNYYKQNYEI